MSNKAELQRDIDTMGREILSARGRAKSILATADREHRDLTETERRSSDRLADEIDVLLSARDRAESELNDEIGREGRRSNGRMVAAELPLNHSGNALAHNGDRSRAIPGGRRAVDMFSAQSDPYGGAFKNLGDFCRAVTAGNDSRLMVSNSAMSDGVGTSGGFLVPEEWAWGILDAALAKEAIRPRALVLPMTSNILNVPGFDYLDGTGGKRAGLLLTWGGEAQALTEQAAKTRIVAVVAKKASILVRVSTELTEDAPAFDTALSNAMAAAVQIGLDTAFIQGTGAGQPQGILNSPAAITIAKEAGQAANTLLLQNLAKMLSRLAPASNDTAVWLVHPTVLPLLYTLVVVIQNVAGTENVGGSLVGAVTQTADGSLRIFGIEVVVTEACSSLSSAGDVILADLDEYVIGLRRDITIERSQHIYFTSDEIGFRLRMRLDGQPLAASATKLRDGTNTVSPFVILGAR